LAEAFNIVSYINVGTRTIFGLANGEIKFIDNGNFNVIQTATVNNSFTGTNRFVYRIWKSGTNLFAVLNADYQQLYKSTDNGTNWDNVTTTRSDSQFEPNLLSTFINGTSDGRIYFINKTSPDDKVYVSTDGGLSAVSISLPTEINTNTFDLDKILVNGNKVWLSVRAFDEVDFISTNSAVAGLYALEGASNSLSEINSNIDLFPNPFTSSLIVKSEGSATISLVSLEGKEVFNSDFNNLLEINTEYLEVGTYLLSIQTKEGVLTKKVIKY
jgi:hypothetical protein